MNQPISVKEAFDQVEQISKALEGSTEGNAMLIRATLKTLGAVLYGDQEDAEEWLEIITEFSASKNKKYNA